MFEGRLLNAAPAPTSGLMTPARPPIPVTVTLQGQGWGDTYEAGDSYALAWSRDAVFVLIWLTYPDMPRRARSLLLWVTPESVKRRQT